MKKICISPSLLYFVEGRNVSPFEIDGILDLASRQTHFLEDYTHIDLMEKGTLVGHDSYFRNMEVIERMDESTRLGLDFHLMVDNPWKYIEHLSAMYNTEIVTFHAEAASDPKSLVDRIHGFENRRRNNEHVKAGIALNPKTPLDAVSKILPYVDMVLLMSVVPGACNQAYDDSVTGKISRLRDMINEKGLNTIIQVDGGIKQGNAYKVINAGADCAGGLIIVSGSGIYGAKQPVEVIDAMRHPVLVGADHGGVDLKNKFIDIFQGDGIPYFDFGTHGGPDVSVDHPIFARLVAENISSGRYKRGILVCGTGIGMSIGANRFENVRATVLYDASVDGKRIAQLAREHNDSNLAIFGSRSMDHETAKKDLYLWLNTPHLGGKYTARNGMFDMPG